MTPVAQYDLRNAVGELLQAGFEPALVGYLEAPVLVAAARLPKRRRTPCGTLGSLAAMVAQRLHGLSQAATLQLLGLRCGQSLDARSGAYSRALRKLPAGLVQRTAEQAGRRAAGLAAGPEPLRIKLMDGSSAHLLDTPENQAVYPQSSTQAAGVGWPTVHFVALTDAASGAILALSSGSLKDHDAQLGRRLWHLLGPGDLGVVDRGFSSYGFLWGMRKRGAQVVVRQHQRRRNSQPMPAQIGEVVDFDETWQRPSKRTDWWDPDLPPTLQVRVVAVRLSADQVLLVNTMLPREEYPAEMVLEFFRVRQRVETGFNELKTTLDAALIEIQDPAVAVDNLWGAMLTHNLLCCLMSEAAAEQGLTRWALSYRICLELVRMPSKAGVQAGPEEEAKRVRAELTRYPHPRRDPDRQEPRATKSPHRPHRRLRGKRKDELARLGR